MSCTRHSYFRLSDVVSFFKMPSVGAKAIVDAEIHDKVEDILIAAKNWIKRAEHFCFFYLAIALNTAMATFRRERKKIINYVDQLPEMSSDDEDLSTAERKGRLMAAIKMLEEADRAIIALAIIWFLRFRAILLNSEGSSGYRTSLCRIR